MRTYVGYMPCTRSGCVLSVCARTFEGTMTFVRHHAEHPVLSSFQAELEFSTKNFIASSFSALDKRNETNTQGLFATRAVDGISDNTLGNLTVHVASGSAISHWASSDQVQNVPVNTSSKSGSTRNMVEIRGAVSALPSANFGFGLEGHFNSGIAIGLSDGLVNSTHLSRQQVPALVPCSISEDPMFSLERDGGQKDDLPILSLGLSSGQLLHEKAEASSWISKFPFQIGSGSRQQAVPGLANTPLNSAWPLPVATHSGTNTPTLKRDRNATLIQNSKHPQLLPEFFAQQKLMAASEAHRPHFAKSEGLEKINKVAFLQKSLISSVNEENAGSNLASLHATSHGNKSENSFTDQKRTEQQEMKDGEEVRKTRSLSCPQNFHDSSLRPVDLLRDQKDGAVSRFASMKSFQKYDKFDSFEGGVVIKTVPLSSAPAADQAARQPPNGINKTVDASQPAELMLFRDEASTELSSIISLSLLKHSSDFDGPKEGKFSAHKYRQCEGDWGEFLAAPSSFGGKAAEIEGKLMLPFQRRFEQLQKFLKKCDGSDSEYCLRASCFLSKSARSNRSAELESRALRLSVEEGKEMKRAKLLNVLEDLP